MAKYRGALAACTALVIALAASVAGAQAAPMRHPQKMMMHHGKMMHHPMMKRHMMRHRMHKM